MIDRFVTHHAVGFCNLSIYRCTMEDYISERNREWEAHVHKCGFDLNSTDPELVRVAERARDHLYTSKGEWQFNQITGVIALYISTHKVEGMLFHRLGRVTRLMAPGKLSHCGHILDIDISDETDSSGIYRKFRQALEESVKISKRLKGEWVDYQPLDTLGPYVNWLAMSQTFHKRLS